MEKWAASDGKTRSAVHFKSSRIAIAHFRTENVSLVSGGDSERAALRQSILRGSHAQSIPILLSQAWRPVFADDQIFRLKRKRARSGEIQFPFPLADKEMRKSAFADDPNGV